MFDSDDQLQKLTVPAIIAVAAGFARFAFSEKRSVWSFFRGITIAGFVGAMTTLGLDSVHIEPSMKGVIIGVTAFCADEVALFALAAANEVRKDPLRYISNILDAVRGVNAVPRPSGEIVVPKSDVGDPKP